MYWLELVNTILSNEEDKPVASKPQARRSDSGYKKDFQATKRSFEKPDYSNTSKSVKKDGAYCLFATSGQSFEAMYQNQKITVLLKGIDFPDKNNYTSKKANFFINEQIKKKTIFLDKIEIIDRNTIVAEVYLDTQKTLSLNQLMIEQNLDKVQKRNYPSYEKNIAKNNNVLKGESTIVEKSHNTLMPEQPLDNPPIALPVNKEEQEMTHVNHLLSEAQHEGDSAPIDYPWSDESVPVEYGEEYSPPYEWESVEEAQIKSELVENSEPPSEPFQEINELNEASSISSPIEITPTMDDILSVFDSPPNTSGTLEHSENSALPIEKEENTNIEKLVLKKTKGFGLTR